MGQMLNNNYANRLTRDVVGKLRHLVPQWRLTSGRGVERGKREGRGEQGRGMVEASILSVTEALGKWIVVDLQLSYLCILVCRNSHKFCIWNRDDDFWLTSWLKYNLHSVLVHGVEQHLQGEGKGTVTPCSLP